jgi:hypothetical protein
MTDFFKSIKIAIPSLNAKDRNKPEDLADFFAWKSRLETYLMGVGLWDTLMGRETIIRKPETPKPSLTVIGELKEKIKNENDSSEKQQLKNQLASVRKIRTRWYAFHEAEKDVLMKKSQLAMILKQSFNTEAIMKFSVLTKENDPIVMYNNLCEYFVQSSEQIIQGLITDIRKIVRKEGESIDNLAIRIKIISTHLETLGRPESESSLKEIFMSAVKTSDASARATLETIFNSDSYSNMTFDQLQTRVANGMKFHDNVKKSGDVANFVQNKGPNKKRQIEKESKS